MNRQDYKATVSIKIISKFVRGNKIHLQIPAMQIHCKVENNGYNKKNGNKYRLA